ncbi:MAG: DUF3857 domain-containing protein [Bacteroidota bacterium]
MNKYLLSFIFLLVINRVYSQEFHDTTFNKITETSDITILDEKSSIDFTSQKASDMRVRYTKSVTFQIHTSKGVKELSMLEFPELMDETYIVHCPSIKGNLRIPDQMKMEKFEVFKMNDDGTETALKYSITTAESKCVDMNREKFLRNKKYSYSINGIEKGQRFKISYIYYVPYLDNAYQFFSIRHYFNGKYPKKEMTFSLSFHDKIKLDTTFYKERPEITTKDGRVFLNWKMKNLTGCLDEPGAQLYRDIPWVVFNPKPDGFLYTAYKSYDREFIPFWFFYCVSKERNIALARVENYDKVKNLNHVAFRELAEKYSELGKADSSGLASIRFFQRWMVDTVRYDPALKRYSEEDVSIPTPGKDLSGEMLKDFNRELCYGNMILKMKMNFLSAYLTDKRIGEISTHYYSSIYDSDMLLAVILKDKSIAYLYPISDRAHYYCEELPFYFEKVPAMILQTYDIAGRQRDFNINPDIVYTPASATNDNSRKTNSLVNADLTKGDISFKTKVSLAGQFSTLTRFVYQKRSCDSTINPEYFTKVYALNDQVKVNKTDVSKTKIYFPFATTVNCEYTAPGIIKKNEKTYSVSLKNWFHHIITKGIVSNYRFTDYYPDFCGSDTYMYMIQFEQAVKVTGKTQNFHIENAFGTYTFSISQNDPKQIVVSSYFLIKSPRVEKQNFNFVKEIFNAIEKIDLSEIQFEVVE